MAECSDRFRAVGFFAIQHSSTKSLTSSELHSRSGGLVMRCRIVAVRFCHRWSERFMLRQRSTIIEQGPAMVHT